MVGDFMDHHVAGLKTKCLDYINPTLSALKTEFQVDSACNVRIKKRKNKVKLFSVTVVSTH